MTNRLESLQNTLYKCLDANTEALKRSVHGLESLCLSEQSELAKNAAFVSTFLLDVVLHHANTDYPFTKDKFEQAMQRAFQACNMEVEMPEAKNNPVFDMRIVSPVNLKISCKSEASSSATLNKVKVAKWKELSRWQDSSVPLEFAQEFHELVDTLDKVYMLRCLALKNSSNQIDKSRKYYELLEIPVKLVQNLKHCQFSQKKSHKIFYLESSSPFGLVQAQFIGGGERKLALSIDRSACKVHFSWIMQLSDRKMLLPVQDQGCNLILESTRNLIPEALSSKTHPESTADTHNDVSTMQFQLWGD